MFNKMNHYLLPYSTIVSQFYHIKFLSNFTDLFLYLVGNCEVITIGIFNSFVQGCWLKAVSFI